MQVLNYTDSARLFCQRQYVAAQPQAQRPFDHLYHEQADVY